MSSTNNHLKLINLKNEGGSVSLFTCLSYFPLKFLQATPPLCFVQVSHWESLENSSVFTIGSCPLLEKMLETIIFYQKKLENISHLPLFCTPNGMLSCWRIVSWQKENKIGYTQFNSKPTSQKGNFHLLKYLINTDIISLDYWWTNIKMRTPKHLQRLNISKQYKTQLTCMVYDPSVSAMLFENVHALSRNRSTRSL